MKRFTSTTTLIIALAATAAGAEAQRGSAITISRGSFAVVPFAGYLISENFIDGPLNTSLGSGGALLYGVQANLPLAPIASLVGTVGYSGGNLEVGAPIIGGVRVGDSNALVFDASVELRASSSNARVVPLVQFGGGAIRREVSVAGLSATATDFQVSGGVGADIPIASNVGLRLLAKDHYGKADFGGLGELRARTRDIHTLALTGGLYITF